MKYLLSLILVLILSTSAFAVDITIKLPVENAVVTDGVVDWTPALKAAATEISMLNAGLPILTADPIPVNPDADQLENMIGDVVTIPNEYGYCTARISKWRKLIIPRGISPTTFEFVYGVPIEDKQVGVDEEGKPIYETVYGGVIAE